jgi:hypothetical protein
MEVQTKEGLPAVVSADTDKIMCALSPVLLEQVHSRTPIRSERLQVITRVRALLTGKLTDILKAFGTPPSFTPEFVSYLAASLKPVVAESVANVIREVEAEERESSIRRSKCYRLHCRYLEAHGCASLTGATAFAAKCLADGVPIELEDDALVADWYALARDIEAEDGLDAAVADFADSLWNRVAEPD